MLSKSLVTLSKDILTKHTAVPKHLHGAVRDLHYLPNSKSMITRNLSDDRWPRLDKDYLEYLAYGGHPARTLEDIEIDEGILSALRTDSTGADSDDNYYTGEFEKIQQSPKPDPMQHSEGGMWTAWRDPIASQINLINPPGEHESDSDNEYDRVVSEAETTISNEIPAGEWRDPLTAKIQLANPPGEYEHHNISML